MTVKLTSTESLLWFSFIIYCWSHYRLLSRFSISYCCLRSIASVCWFFMICFICEFLSCSWCFCCWIILKASLFSCFKLSASNFAFRTVSVFFSFSLFWVCYLSSWFLWACSSLSLAFLFSLSCFSLSFSLFLTLTLCTSVAFFLVSSIFFQAFLSSAFKRAILLAKSLTSSWALFLPTLESTSFSVIFSPYNCCSYSWSKYSGWSCSSEKS